jgi:hypothetical protein
MEPKGYYHVYKNPLLVPQAIINFELVNDKTSLTLNITRINVHTVMLTQLTKYLTINNLCMAVSVMVCNQVEVTL